MDKVATPSVMSDRLEPVDARGRYFRERSRQRARLRLVTSVGLLGWASCSVYDEGLLADAIGTGGTPGAGGSTGGTAGASSGNGGNGGNGDNGGSTTGGSGGTSGAGGATAGASGKGSGGSAGTGGSAGKGSGGSAGTGGSAAGKGGSASGGIVGMAGEGGDGGCPMDDCCPTDSAKTDPGVCGCGVADTDADGDTILDCLESCDDDPEKTSPEMCGCGVAEASCLPLKTSLVHRYSFNGTGTTVTDTKGTAHGTAMGTGIMLSGTGTLALAGGYVPSASDPNKHYVALPAGCLDGLTNATFEAWVNWTPAADGTNAQSFWQRIFDFGETAASGSGTYLFATPRATGTTGTARVSFTSSMGSTGQVFANGVLLAAGMHHFTVVVDDTNDLMSLYVDGAPAGSVAFPGTLSAINDTSCYLGRSHFAADPYFSGTLDEVRVHSAAFTPADVTFSHASGPNPAFL